MRPAPFGELARSIPCELKQGSVRKSVQLSFDRGTHHHCQLERMDRQRTRSTLRRRLVDLGSERRVVAKHLMKRMDDEGPKTWYRVVAVGEGEEPSEGIV